MGRRAVDGRVASGYTVSGRDPSALLALAGDVVARAEKAGATEAEVLLTAQDAALTRFANSEIHQNVSETGTSLNLRFVVGKRIGVASSGRTDAEGLLRLVETAAAIARSGEELESWAGLPEPADPADAATRGPARSARAVGTADATPEFRASGAREVIAAADAEGVTAYGSFATTEETVVIANSRGIGVSESRTNSQLITVHMSPDGGTGYAEAVAVDATTIDAGALGREAAAKARATDHARAIEPGDYPVVLEPYAVVDIVDMLGYVGFSALAVEEGRSFYAPGKRIGSELVDVVDDPSAVTGLPMAFDYEGVEKRPLTLVHAGVCVDVVHDAQTAARAGVRSTGHGLPAPNPYGPFPLNMVMAPGTSSMDELIGGMDRGLLVTRFHYTNVVHPKLAIITGMTRDGTFLVENGRIVGPVRNLRFTQSYLDALAGVEAVGRERRTLRGFLGAVVVPSLRISSWTFTGATEH